MQVKKNHPMVPSFMSCMKILGSPRSHNLAVAKTGELCDVAWGARQSWSTYPRGCGEVCWVRGAQNEKSMGLLKGTLPFSEMRPWIFTVYFHNHDPLIRPYFIGGVVSLQCSAWHHGRFLPVLCLQLLQIQWCTECWTHQPGRNWWIGCGSLRNATAQNSNHSW